MLTSELAPPLAVVAAVLFDGDRILCVRRALNKRPYISEKWEFPGGKPEPGESLPAALAREIREELGLDVQVGEPLTVVDHCYPDLHLHLHAYRCTARDLTALRLNEHTDLRWLSPADPNFAALDWAAADLPIVNELLK
jgi:8-oxo-dGTP diphosphatase